MNVLKTGIVAALLAIGLLCARAPGAPAAMAPAGLLSAAPGDSYVHLVQYRGDGYYRGRGYGGRHHHRRHHDRRYRY